MLFSTVPDLSSTYSPTPSGPLDSRRGLAIALGLTIIPAPALLERHRRYRTAHPALISQILDLLPRPSRSAPSPASQARWARSRGPDEQLTDSDIRVLRYMTTNLSTPDIARELSLSVHTVRTHVRHLFAKLGAHRRTEAVARACALGLLVPSPARPEAHWNTAATPGTNK